MYVCLRCKEIFKEPKRFYEKHNLDTAPYEEWSGCPRCYGAYVKTKRCTECNDYIVSNRFYEVEGDAFCEDCFSVETRYLEDLR